MRRTVMLVVSAVALLAVPGCGSSGGPAAYLGTGASEVIFIQWQQSSSGHLQGTFIQDRESGSAPSLTISPTSAPFTGNVNGSSVSITFTGYFGASANVVGSLNGSTLTLQIPQASGTIQQDTFSASSVSSFNSAIAALRSRIHHVNALAAAALAQHQRQAAKAAAAAKKRAVAAADKQAADNTAADATAHAACRQYGGQWSAPGTVSYTADGYTLTITGDPQNASCANVPYLGSDDATYYLTVNFSVTGTAAPVKGWTGTANPSDCDRGWYPNDSTGPSYAKPGNWSSVLGLCLAPG
jgi:hypothetical protein